MATVKYNFWCENCTCGASGKDREFSINKEESKESNIEKCPNNKRRKLKMIGYKPFTSVTMSKPERIASLKKRSKEHFVKNIKEQKIDMIRKSTARR